MVDALVEVHGLTKAYSGHVAVDDVDFVVRPGEIVGLLGKNGAGKSTLIKVMAGVESADSGTITLGERHVDPARHDARSARAAGLAVMFQELEIFPGLTVAENVAIGTGLPRRRGGLVDQVTLVARVQAVIDSLDPRIRASSQIESLSAAEQRTVMIGRALYQGARLLVLDEPTTSLTDREIVALHSLLARLAASGHGIVYVSHRLDEVMAITDRTVIMRDGKVVGTQQTAATNVESLIAAITGDGSATTASQRRQRQGVVVAETDVPCLSVRDVSRTGDLYGITFDARPGEILGIAGLVGSGRSELVRAIFGADRRESGTISVDGTYVPISSPRQAIQAGIVLLPEDRRHQGLISSFCIRENVTLPSLGHFRRGPLPTPSRRREHRATETLMHNLRIKAQGQEQLVSTLSGGNQQKVVIAKWMLRAGRVFIFDEPTQGIDVDAKEEVYSLMEDLARRGATVLLISSEFSELVSICSRVIVLREGRLVATLTDSDVTEEAITDECYARPRQSDRSPVFITTEGNHHHE